MKQSLCYFHNYYFCNWILIYQLRTCFRVFQTNTVLKMGCHDLQVPANMIIFRTTLGLLLILSVTCPSIAQKTSDNTSSMSTTRLSTSARTYSRFSMCYWEGSPLFIFMVLFLIRKELKFWKSKLLNYVNYGPKLCMLFKNCRWFCVF